MSRWQETWKQIETLGAQLGLGAFIAIVFLVPEQMHEIYRAAAQNLAWRLNIEDGVGLALARDSSEVLFAVIGIALVSITLWMTARHAGYVKSDAAGVNGQGGAVTQWVPRILAAVPAAFLAAGLLEARISDEDKRVTVNQMIEGALTNQFMAGGDNLEDATELAREALSTYGPFNDYILYFAGFLFALAVLLFFAVTAVDRAQSLEMLLGRRTLIRGRFSVIVISALVTTIVAFLVNPVELPQTIGTVGVLCLFLIFLMLFVAQLHVWGRSINTPILLIMLLAAAVFSALDLNDNHIVRETENAVAAPPSYGVASAFSRWFVTRKDKDDYAGRRYPIYVVAAQGGGIYAAHHVSSYLATVQDVCPPFSHHLFAISGVSGGSVGATIFSRLAREEGEVQRWREKPPGDSTPTAGRRCFTEGEKRPLRYLYATEEIFRDDLLAPLTASLLFPDFLQRFLPFPVGKFDRSRALDYALESAYQRAHVKSGFMTGLDHTPSTLSESFIEHWEPERYPNAPALLLNTTDAATGERVVISPFHFNGAGLRFFPVWNDTGPNALKPVSVPLSTTAFLSARFPWVTPAGAFFEIPADGASKTKPKKRRVVDGGYFENSGVATALDLVGEILANARKVGVADEIEIVLIVFSTAGFDVNPSYGFSETAEPIRAMLSTRTARARIEINKAISTLRSWSTNGVMLKAQLVQLQLEGHGYPLPLGWRLSDVTRHLISQQNGVQLACSPKDLAEMEVGGGVAAGCVTKTIFDQLN